MFVPSKETECSVLRLCVAASGCSGCVNSRAQATDRINAAAGKKCVVHHLFAGSMSGGYRGQYYRRQRDSWGEAGGYEARGGWGSHGD